MPKTYFTTPIYYVNDLPHIGHAYTTVVADVLARYHRLFGDEVLLLTGVDEHGQKVQQAAEKKGLDPQKYCDEIQLGWRTIWEELQIQYDIFFRTTDAFHKKAVQAALQFLWDKGDIYCKDYEGLYSVSEEIFYTEKDLVDGKTPQGNDVISIKEKNYFFKMSNYQDKIIEALNAGNFVLPEYRKNEVLGFLKKPLNDLCISRPKARLSWGIELPFDKDFVTYVWFDALLNYATGVGYQQKERSADFEKWWQSRSVVHLIGKDILTTHAVYWPAMLMALGIEIPKSIFAHGWWLAAGGEKMSKSKGNSVRPLDMKNLVGVDPLRYFLVREVTLGNDASFSPDLVVNRVNAELANNLGNLLSRATNLIDKNFSSIVPEYPENLSTETKSLLDALPKTSKEIEEQVRALAPQNALQAIVNLLNDTNKYIGDRAPWKQVKTDLSAAAETLATSLAILKFAGIYLSPVMPEKMNRLLSTIGFTGEKTIQEALNWKKSSSLKITKGDPLFPRVELIEKD
ncbi:MAG: methionine--tRNA ligase [Oligoflexia bacterium]|nr:methionine--tRNA ligase [Oligoflexia bacterium]